MFLEDDIREREMKQKADKFLSCTHRAENLERPRELELIRQNAEKDRSMQTENPDYLQIITLKYSA